MINLNSHKAKIIFFYWLPVIGYAMLIFLLSSFSLSAKESNVPHLDKIFHLAEYSVFGFLVLRAMMKSFPKANLKKCYLLAILVACLYAISDEYHQLFIANREFSVYDIFADTIGGSLGAFLFLKNRFS